MDEGLWGRLRAFQIDEPGAELSFARRLARENAWSPGFAEQAILEYKKFLYLIATSGAELTPSDVVDQVWHLHLCYTRSYWQGLCEGVLGFSLHHQPTRGGEAQQAHFRHTYQQTLDVYREAFGVPLAAIWPSVDARFRDAAGFVRISRACSWLIPKPSAALQSSILVSATALLVACTPQEGESPLWFWLKVGVGVWGIYVVAKLINNTLGGGRGRGGGGGCGGFGCSGCGGCGGGD